MQFWYRCIGHTDHRRRSSVNFRGHDIFARKICRKKLTKFLNFTWFLPEKNKLNTRIFIIFSRKINKIVEFYMIFSRKMPEFYIIIYCPKNIFPNFRGHVPPAPCLLHLWYRYCRYRYRIGVLILFFSIYRILSVTKEISVIFFVNCAYFFCLIKQLRLVCGP